MPDPQQQRASEPPEELSSSVPAVDSPLTLIPMTAEDAARETRRKRAIWIAIVVAVALLAGWAYKRSTDPLRAQQSLDAAKQLYDDARYAQAIVACDRAVGLKPDLVEAYLLRGRAHAAVYQHDEAVGDFTRAIALQPADPRSFLERASVYVDRKNYGAAIADAKAALALNPKLSAAYNLWGTALRGLGDSKTAVTEFTNAVEIEPTFDNLFQRGATYQLTGDHQRALDDFTQAIALLPDQPQAYFARAESERALGMTGQAEIDHRRGRVLDGK